MKRKGALRLAFGLWFTFCALLGLAVTGFLAWAIYTLVTHYAK